MASKPSQESGSGHIGTVISVSTGGAITSLQSSYEPFFLDNVVASL